ncbi:unnamed protein product [Adineta steineri]|uniref:F-box domain-containing protein n=1 Tax=Adineta steineri TaxID=433720 RepID=A0A815FU95_9BILA|nr:unnamed protein product [Adineta steineri]CAF1586769.1 unnamed protein product [Adineta steineri]
MSSYKNTNTTYPIQTFDVPKFLKEHPFLSGLLKKDGNLFQCDGDAPSPSKDYGQLQINSNTVVLRWWKITLRNIEGSIYPGEIKNSYEDFYHDEIAQREISRIFGKKTLDYCLHLVCGQIDWLSRLPLNIQIKICSFLNLDDIPRLSLVSKLFRSICRHNDLWKILYMYQHGRHALENKNLIQLAEKRGWRHVFFTNRLKLQIELRREAQLEHYHPEDPSDLVKARERRHKLQPSPPVSAREQPSVRRHSIAIRKGSPLPDRRGSAKTDIVHRSDSPLLSARSFDSRSMNSTPLLRSPTNH